MKTVDLLIVILSFFSVVAFSQKKIDKNAKQYYDMNGVPQSNNSIRLSAPYSSGSFLKAYIYDSVRALTEINTVGSADAYPWISSDGLRLYFTNGLSGDHLVFTQRANTNSYFVTPTTIPIALYNPLSCWLSTNELDIYLSDGFHLYYAHRNSVLSPFDTPVNITLYGTPNVFFSGPSLNAAQDHLFLFFENNRIIESSRSSDTSFTYTRTLPAPNGYDIYPGQLSKDELTFFFGASYLNGTDLLYQMTRTSPNDTFDVSTFQQIQGINDTTYVYNGQPSMSDNLNWVAFTRGNDNSWDANDLYLAHKGITTSVFNPEEMRINSSAYPNPSSEYVIITYKTSSSTPLSLSICSSEGTLVYENVMSPASRQIKIDTKMIANGFYFYKLSLVSDKKNQFGRGKFVVLH
jgi:hypothetical protein